jgi:hypothetical protein
LRSATSARPRWCSSAPLSGATLLLPIAALRGNLGPLRAHWKIVVVYTLIEVALPWFLLADAERRLSSSFSHLAWRKQATLSAKLHRQPQGNIDVLDRRLR